MFNQIPPAVAGGSFNPSLPGTGKIRGFPPPAGGGIPEYSYVSCRSGLNHPPPAGGGIPESLYMWRYRCVFPVVVAVYAIANRSSDFLPSLGRRGVPDISRATSA